MNRADQVSIGAALDALDDVFYVFDREDGLVRWNRRLNDVFGRTDDELRGTSPEAFFVEADRPAVRRAAVEAFETGETVVEAHAETVDGVVRFQLTGRRLTETDGTVVGLCGVGRDVTEQRENERLLARQNERLDAFADVLSHDLRNPLTVATGFLDVARTDRDWTALETVETALVRIERIIDDVLTISREGRVVSNPRPLDVETVARAAWETTATDGATLSVPSTTTVVADETRLRRLFENLFRNAVEHGATSQQATAADAAEHGCPDCHVVVDVTEVGFAVEDAGPGIPAADRERVFTPGFSNSTDGTGLGLAIVTTIAEAHGWSVTATEGTDGGARFEFDVRHSPVSATDSRAERV
jgi:PAS domain S-box-containing protein